MRPSFGTTVLALSASLLLLSCGRNAPAELRPTRGYILISLDTLRADHLGCYGYARDTSPFLDGLAAEGAILFERAIVQYPSTLTSHMSMLTGLYPAEHGVYPPSSVLSPTIDTLPEAFARAGFRTAGFTEGGYMRGRFGFRRGFQEFKARDRRGPRQMETTFARGTRFLADLEPDDKFFLFLHTYAPHAPYDPPAEYRNRYWKDEPPDIFAPTGPNLSRQNRDGGRLEPEALAYFEALYDATLNYIDDVLADFFDQLEALGIRDETTVIITSDHGEEFQEHGKLNHTQLYDEVLHVPLVVVHPGIGRGRRVGSLVESVDLAPTLLAMAGIEPDSSLPGRNLVLLAGDEREDARSVARAAGTRQSRSLYHRSAGRLLHLLAFEKPSNGGERGHELYEILSDPQESHDLSQELHDISQSLLERLEDSSLRRRAPARTKPLDSDLERSLRSLGYLD